MLIWDDDGFLASREPQLLCSFGIVEAIGAAIAGISAGFGAAGAGIAGGLGLDAGVGTAIGAGLEGATTGALIGGGVDAATGKPILPGVLEGGLVGGATGGLGPAVGSGLGIGSEAGGALVGAGAGALGSEFTGGNPLTGAATGAASGLLSGALNGTGGAAGTPGSTTTPGISGGPGPSAVGAAAPTGLGDPGVGPFVDQTSGFTPSGGAAAGATAPGAVGGNAGFADATSGFGAPPVAGAVSGLGSPPASGPSDVFTGFTSSTSGPAPADAASGAVTGTDQAAVDAVGIPPAPPFGTNELGVSTAPPSNYQIPGTAPATGIPGVNSAEGTSTVSNPGILGSLFGSNSSIAQALNGTGSVGDALSKNAGWLVPGALIGYEGLKSSEGLKNVPGYSGLTGTANQLSSQSTQLQSYLTNGTLPPGLAQSLTQAGNAAKAAIRGQYASRGMSGSSAEAQDLANVETTIASNGANIATQLLQTGVNEAQLSSSLYSQILNASLSEDNQLGTALGTLAAGASRPTVTIAGTASG